MCQNKAECGRQENKHSSRIPDNWLHRGGETMAQKLLIVVDMLNDFINHGGAFDCGNKARAIVPFVVQKIKEYMAEGLPIVFLMDAHDPEDLEFQSLPVHCVFGTEGARLIKEIEDVIEEYSFAMKLPKSSSNGFYRTNLNEILKDLRPRVVEMVGVCTNTSILYTVGELRNRNYKVVIYRDGVASYDPNAHLWALNQMETLLGAEMV